jgi:hypothetical protein
MRVITRELSSCSLPLASFEIHLAIMLVQCMAEKPSSARGDKPGRRKYLVAMERFQTVLQAFTLFCCTTTDVSTSNRGGTFTFSFSIPTIYPHEAPKVKCKTKVSVFIRGLCMKLLGAVFFSQSSA